MIAAVDRSLGREVALKRMRHSDPTGDAVHRFVREAKVQALLDHPAIVPVHELGVCYVDDQGARGSAASRAYPGVAHATDDPAR